MPFVARNVYDEQLLWKIRELMQHQNVHRNQVSFHQDAITKQKTFISTKILVKKKNYLPLGKDADNVVDDDEVVVQELVLVLM